MDLYVHVSKDLKNQAPRTKHQGEHTKSIQIHTKYLWAFLTSSSVISKHQMSLATSNHYSRVIRGLDFAIFCQSIREDLWTPKMEVGLLREVIKMKNWQVRPQQRAREMRKSSEASQAWWVYWPRNAGMNEKTAWSIINMRYDLKMLEARCTCNCRLAIWVLRDCPRKLFEAVADWLKPRSGSVGGSGKLKHNG